MRSWRRVRRRQTSSMSNGLLRDEHHRRPTGDPGVGGDPAAVAAHHLDDHHPVVALGRRVQPVDGVGGDLHRGVEAERDVGALDVVVDRLRDADDRQAVLGVQPAGDRQRAVAADDDDGVEAEVGDRRRRPRRPRPRCRTGSPASCRARCRPAAACRASSRPSAASSCGARGRRPTRRGSRRSRRRRSRSPWRTIARMTAFRPGQSPPPVSTPTRTGRSVRGWRPRRSGAIHRGCGLGLEPPGAVEAADQGVGDLRRDHGGRSSSSCSATADRCCRSSAACSSADRSTSCSAAVLAKFGYQRKTLRRAARRRRASPRGVERRRRAGAPPRSRRRPATDVERADRQRPTSAARAAMTLRRRHRRRHDRRPQPGGVHRRPPGRVLRTGSSPSTSPDRAGSSTTPTEIWEAVRATLTEVVDRVGRADVAAIGITNQRETVVAWDRSTGQPYGRAIVWQDRRTAARCDELAAGGRPRPRAAAHRPRARPVLQRHQVRVAAAARAACPSPPTWRSARSTPG